MTPDDGLRFYALLAAIGGLALTIGYLVGLRRFGARATRELEDARRLADEKSQAWTSAERALGDARTAASRAREDAQQAKTAADRAHADVQDAQAQLAARRFPVVTHTVLLDGVSKSGKSTLVHRLAFPCTDPDSLEKIAATQLAYRTRVLPICFVPSEGGGGAGGAGAGGAAGSGAGAGGAGAGGAGAGGAGGAGGGAGAATAEAAVLHAQVLRDIAGEKPEDVVNIFEELAAERDRAPEGEQRPGAVIAVLIWDMADPARSRDSITERQLRVAYRNKNARRLIKHLVVFFNKLDLLDVPRARAEQLVADERAHLEAITDFFDADVKRTYIQGSALRGDGVIECQGAIYAALGLESHFRATDVRASELRAVDAGKIGKAP